MGLGAGNTVYTEHAVWLSHDVFKGRNFAPEQRVSAFRALTRQDNATYHQVSEHCLGVASVLVQHLDPWHRQGRLVCLAYSHRQGLA